MIKTRELFHYSDDGRVTIEKDVDTCPFCDHDDLELKLGAIDDTWYISGHILCAGCGCKSPSASTSYTSYNNDFKENMELCLDKVIAAWNKRSATPTTPEALEEWRKHLDMCAQSINEYALKELITGEA